MINRDPSIVRHYLDSVRRNGLAIQNIPEDELTPEICLAAVQQDGLALQYIREDKLTPEICLAAVEQNESALQYVPEYLLTTGMCVAAVRQFGCGLKDIPENHQTPEVILAAVQKDGSALQYVHESKMTPEILLAAVQQMGLALRFVPENKRTPEILLAALKKNGHALQFIPDDKRTPELCLAAVQQNGYALKYLFDDQLTPNVCFAAVSQEGLALRYVPDEKLTPDILLAAVQQNGLALQYVPEDKLTPEIYLAAVQQNGLALQYINEKNRSRALCLIAVQQDGDALQYVAEYKRTPDMYLSAVQRNGLALQYIANGEKTLQLCLMAVQQNSLALQYVPDEMRAAIIHSIGHEKILANDYSVWNHFPQKEYAKARVDFLSNIEYLIVTDSDNYDHEIKDIHLVYAEASERLDKTVHVHKNDLDQILADLQQYNARHINLVLCGHANENDVELGGVHVDDAVNICKEHKQIDQITLLGCNTAKAMKPDQEQEIIRQFTEKAKLKEKIKYGLASIVSAADTPASSQSELLRLLKAKKLDSMYIVEKQPRQEKDQYHIIHAKKNPSNEGDIIEKKYVIPESRVSDLPKILNGTKESLPFPSTEGKIELIKQQQMVARELQVIQNIICSEKRFSKKHPRYLKDKKTHPFLRNIEMREDESYKLRTSLLHKLVAAFHRDPDFTREITIKGYTQALHVDTHERKMHVTRTHLYPSTYKKSLFHRPDQININYKKLTDEQNKIMLRIKKEPVNDSVAKSLSIKIKSAG